MASRQAPPPLSRFIVASILSILTSLGADAVLVKIGTSLFPSIRGYSHFRFSDYGTLTILGVLGACASWPVILRLTAVPRWLFFRLAIVATLALWIPDLYLLVKHEPVKAVAVLMVMHLAIALTTYNLLVHLAGQPDGTVTEHTRTPETLIPRSFDDRAFSTESEPRYVVSRVTWIVLMSSVCAEFVLGLAGLLFVPITRPGGLIPAHGQVLYLCHAIIGGLLGLGAMGVLVRSRLEGRIVRLGARLGLIGVGIAALGGILAVHQYHPWRLVGLVLMFVGGAIAFFGYLVPILETSQNVEEMRPTGEFDLPN